MINGMKKLLVVALLSSATASASASLIAVKASEANPLFSGETFDFSSLTVQSENAEGSSISQSPTGVFTETGMIDVVNYNDSAAFASVGANIFFDMDLIGTSMPSLDGQSLAIDFSSASVAGMYYEDTLAGTAALQIADLSLISGECMVDISVQTEEEGNCNLVFNFDVIEAGYLSSADWGYDLVDDAYATIAFEISVDQLIGFDLSELLAGNMLDIEGYHSGTATIQVPEPTSLAILGLGLLGLAGVRRRA